MFPAERESYHLLQSLPCDNESLVNKAVELFCRCLHNRYIRDFCCIFFYTCPHVKKGKKELSMASTLGNNCEGGGDSGVCASYQLPGSRSKIISNASL